MTEAGDSRTSGAPLAILYRGTLSSCNYGCAYCPFAKRVDTREQLADDAEDLRRFIDWVSERDASTSVFFTPWGEALIRQPYQRALARLTHMPHVGRAAIQTNLSMALSWVDDCVAERLGIWATFHPGWSQRDAFVARVTQLHERGVQVSAGVVGMREHLDAIADLRARLPDAVYLWVNAYKRIPGYYRADELAFLREIDPLFPMNNRYHPSRDRACRAGEQVISVAGDGRVRRCHFIAEVIGNIYDADFERSLQPRLCSNDTCGCHIGYAHLSHLGLDRVFGAGILERVPAVPRAQLAHYRLPLHPP